MSNGGSWRISTTSIWPSSIPSIGPRSAWAPRSGFTVTVWPRANSRPSSSARVRTSYTHIRWPRRWASSIIMKVVSASMSTAPIGSIWMATLSMDGPSKLCGNGLALIWPMRCSVQAHPHAIALDRGGGGGLPVQAAGPAQGVERPGQGALLLARGRHVEPRPVILGIEQGPAQGGSFGPLVVAGAQGAVEQHVLQAQQELPVADRGHQQVQPVGHMRRQPGPQRAAGQL